MCTKLICQNDFRPLSTVIVALRLSGQSACLVKRRSLVQIRAAPNMEISFIILFTRFICLNYVYPLCSFLRGLVALWL